jgi:periplasmic protein TonB
MHGVLLAPTDGRARSAAPPQPDPSLVYVESVLVARSDGNTSAVSEPAAAPSAAAPPRRPRRALQEKRPEAAAPTPDSDRLRGEDAAPLAESAGSDPAEDDRAVSEAAIGASGSASVADPAPRAGNGVAGGGLQPLSKLVGASPIYPFAARLRGAEGVVRVRLTVDARGSVRASEVVFAAPPGVFDEAALEAVRTWRFEPAVGGSGQLMRVAEQDIEFRLDR